MPTLNTLIETKAAVDKLTSKISQLNELLGEKELVAEFDGNSTNVLITQDDTDLVRLLIGMAVANYEVKRQPLQAILDDAELLLNPSGPVIEEPPVEEEPNGTT